MALRRVFARITGPKVRNWFEQSDGVNSAISNRQSAIRNGMSLLTSAARGRRESPVRKERCCGTADRRNLPGCDGRTALGRDAATTGGARPPDYKSAIPACQAAARQQHTILRYFAEPATSGTDLRLCFGIRLWLLACTGCYKGMLTGPTQSDAKPEQTTLQTPPFVCALFLHRSVISED